MVRDFSFRRKDVADQVGWLASGFHIILSVILELAYF